MEEKNIRFMGKLFLAVAILLVFSFAGCGMFQKTAPPAPPPAKPEASEPLPSPRVAQEKAPAVPEPPPPPPEQRPAPPEPAPEVKPSPPPPPAPEATPDPVASGAVILNPSAPRDAKTIQARLGELGFYQGPVDGMWGKGLGRLCGNSR